MPRRLDRSEWTPEQDAFLRDCFEGRGWPTRAVHAHWPKSFPPRTAAAIGLRKGVLQIKTAPNPLLSQQGVAQPAPEEPVQSVQLEEQGDTATLRSFGTEVRTIEELIARAKVDLTLWEVDRPETSMHETAVRQVDGSIRKVQQFRLAVKLKRKQGPSTQEQVAALIAGAFADRKPVRLQAAPTSKRLGLNADLMQAVVIADPHIAKLAWPSETGREAWDTGIAVDTLRKGATALMHEGDKRGITERRFVLLGDYFHHDGKGMTTSGTQMDYDSRIQKMLKSGTELLFDLVSESAKSVLTKVYIVPGNHDRVLTWALQLLLQTEFKRHDGVVVDESYLSTKFMTWGRCLIGMDHGDKGKTRLPAHMASQCEVEWGNSICREILTGHLHSKQSIQTVNGITVRTMDSLAPADLYHAEEKFTTSVRTIEAITYHAGGMPAHTDVWSPDLHRAPRKGAA